MNSKIQPISRNIIESILVLLLFLALLFALYDVVKVFFGSLTFALIFSVSFAKTYERLVILLKGRRKLGAILYAVILIGIIAMPLIYLISAMSTHIKEAIHWLGIVKTTGLPPLPDSIGKLPFVGAEIQSFWNELKDSPKETVHSHGHQISLILQNVVAGGLGLLGVALQFVAGIIISSFFLERGENLLRPIKGAITHLLGEPDGLSLLQATAQAIKGVSIGVMGTAFIAALISWIGLTIAGIPFAVGISALIFFFVVIQIGPLIVWIPLIIWQALSGNTGMTIFLIVYLVIILVVDAVLKPVLIAKSGKLPFLVLFLGVVGGLAAWGFTGMFKGAIIMAVFYTLFNSWLERKNVLAINKTTIASSAE